MWSKAALPSQRKNTALARPRMSGNSTRNSPPKPRTDGDGLTAAFIGASLGKAGTVAQSHSPQAISRGKWSMPYRHWLFVPHSLAE